MNDKPYMWTAIAGFAIVMVSWLMGNLVEVESIVSIPSVVFIIGLILVILATPMYFVAKRHKA